MKYISVFSLSLCSLPLLVRLQTFISYGPVLSVSFKAHFVAVRMISLWTVQSPFLSIRTNILWQRTSFTMLWQFLYSKRSLSPMTKSPQGETGVPYYCCSNTRDPRIAGLYCLSSTIFVYLLTCLGQCLHHLWIASDSEGKGKQSISFHSLERIQKRLLSSIPHIVIFNPSFFWKAESLNVLFMATLAKTRHISIPE